MNEFQKKNPMKMITKSRKEDLRKDLDGQILNEINKISKYVNKKIENKNGK